MLPVGLTEHAIDRFHERVKPALDREQAERELRALLEVAEVRRRAPGWAQRGESLVPDAVAMIGDGICLPLLASRQGLVAVSCLARAGLGPTAREARNRQRKARAQARRIRRDKQLQRVNAKRARAADGLR